MLRFPIFVVLQTQLSVAFLLWYLVTQSWFHPTPGAAISEGGSNFPPVVDNFLHFMILCPHFIAAMGSNPIPQTPVESVWFLFTEAGPRTVILFSTNIWCPELGRYSRVTWLVFTLPCSAFFFLKDACPFPIINIKLKSPWGPVWIFTLCTSIAQWSHLHTCFQSPGSPLCLNRSPLLTLV